MSLTGRVVSHYRILENIGGGGMGVVYEAEDLNLGRRVTVKFVASHKSDPTMPDRAGEIRIDAHQVSSAVRRW